MLGSGRKEDGCLRCQTEESAGNTVCHHYADTVSHPPPPVNGKLISVCAYIHRCLSVMCICMSAMCMYVCLSAACMSVNRLLCPIMYLLTYLLSVCLLTISNVCLCVHYTNVCLYVRSVCLYVHSVCLYVRSVCLSVHYIRCLYS